MTTLISCRASKPTDSRSNLQPDELDSHDELVHGDGSSYAQPIDITTLPVQHEQQTNDASARDPRTQALSADYFAQPGRDASVPRPPPRPPAPWSPPQGLLHRHAQFVGDGNRRPSDPHPFGVRQQAFQEQLPPPKRRRSEQHPPPKRRRSKQQPPPKRRRSEQHIPEPRPRQIPPANAEMSLQPAAVSVSSSPIHMAQPPPPLSTQAQESAQHPTPVEAFFPSVHPAIMPGQSTLNPVSAQPAVLVDSLGSPPMLPGYVPEIAPMHDTIPSEHTAFATPPRMHTHEATAGPSGDPWQYAKPEGQSFMETMPVHPPPAFHVRDTSYVNEEIHWQDAAPPTQHQGMPAFYYVNWSGAVPGRVPTMQPCDDVYSSHHVPWHGSIPTASTEIASAAQPSASHNTAGVTQAHPWQDRASGIEGPPMGDVGLCPAPPGPAIHDPHDIRLQGELQAVHAISPTAMRAQSQPLQDRIPGPEQEEPQPVFSFHRVNPDTGLPMRIAAPHKKKVYTFQPLMAGPGQYILEDTSVSGNRRASLDERAVSGPAVRRKRSHHV